MLEYLYIPHRDDKDQIRKFIGELEVLTDDELKTRGESAKRTGICGVHAQALYLIALNYQMNKQLKYSVVEIEDNCLVRIKNNQ